MADIKFTSVQKEYNENANAQKEYSSPEEMYKAKLAELKTQSLLTAKKDFSIQHNLKTDSIYSFNTPKTKSEEFVQSRIDAHTAHNIQAEKMIAHYKELEGVYYKLKDQSHSTIGGLMSQYSVSNKNDLVNTFKEKNVQYDRGVYTNAVSSPSEAYSNYMSALQSANSFTHKIV